jgi:hypothetical protein
MLWLYPAETSAIPLNPLLCTGTSRFTMVPSPTWPPQLPPQAHTVPSNFTATLWLEPPEIPTTELKLPRTCTGASRVVVVLSPTCP